MAGPNSAFADLRRLADWFSTSPQRASVHVQRLVARLGATAIPLLGRELASANPRRREAARAAFATLATAPGARPRVLAALRALIAATPEGSAARGDDETKVCALGLLAELGERGAARFADPTAIQHRSAIALAAQLDTEADVASAADLMVRQLEPADMVQMVQVMAGAVPPAAHRLVIELGLRLDLPPEVRERITAVIPRDVDGATAPPAPLAPPRRRTGRPSQVAVLVDASARLVVVASRKITGERRWRRWAVLIDAHGRIEDCLHEDDGGDEGDAAPLIARLCADGYRVASTDHEHARSVVATSARRTASPATRGTRALPSAYYLGRDLLALGDAHVGDRPALAAATTARAIEHLAAGELARAEALLAQADRGSADAAAATAALRLTRGDATGALEALERALALEPDWPLHHWNHAVASLELGDASAAFHALRRFVSTSATPSGLFGDPAQPGRVAAAERMMAELERTARLTGAPLQRRRRRRTAARAPRAE